MTNVLFTSCIGKYKISKKTYHMLLALENVLSTLKKKRERKSEVLETGIIKYWLNIQYENDARNSTFKVIWMIITWALVQKQWNTSATGKIQHPNPSVSSNFQAPVCTHQSFSWLISMWKVQRDNWASFPLNWQRLVMHWAALPWNDPAICWSSISKDKGWLPVLFF